MTEQPKHFAEVAVRYGVEILWPVLLVQSRMLHVSLAFFDSTKRQQAITFSLESVIEEAIDDDFESSGPLILERWERMNPAHPLLEELLDSRGAQFCTWTKAEGRPRLRPFRKNISNLNVAVRLCTAHCNIQAKNLFQI